MYIRASMTRRRKVSHQAESSGSVLAFQGQDGESTGRQVSSST